MILVDDLIKNAQVNQALPRYIIHSAKDALQPQPLIEWIIDNLLSTGSVSLIVGEPGSKKTWAILYMAVCVALGVPWLNFCTVQGATLIIDEDNGERKLSGRINKILTAHQAPESTPLYYVSLAAFDFGNTNDINELFSLIVEKNVRLVIIDTLAGIMPGRDENSVKDVQPIFMALRRIAERTGTAIVLIHHTNKVGGYRGSSALKAAVDLMLIVSSKPESQNIDFKTEKARDTEPVHFSGVANFMPDKFWLISSPTSGKAQSFNKGQRYVLRYLHLNGESTIQDIKNNADTCSSETARQMVYALVEGGFISRINKGGQGSKAIFGLTDKGKVRVEKA